MKYWLFVLFSLIACCVCGSFVNNYKHKKYIFSIFGLILIYISSFRLGLGTDYSGYLDKYRWENYDGVINWLNEPLFTILSLFIDNSIFTPLLLFLVFSIITIIGILSFYGRDDNKYWVASFAIFTLMPILFFNTFNLVRQFAATGLFFYSIRYIERNQIIPYLICIILATSCHLTAIFLFPLYFIVKKEYKSFTLLFSLLSIFVLISLVLNPIIQSSAILNDRFSLYLETKEQMGISFMILLYNILGFVMLFYRKKFNSTLDIISYNIFFIFILFSDLSYINYYFFRIAVYFSPIFAYVLPKLIHEIFGKKYVTVFSWSFALFFFISFILNNIYNPIVVPSSILPLSALWDSFKYQVVYNICL